MNLNNYKRRWDFIPTFSLHNSLSSMMVHITKCMNNQTSLKQIFTQTFFVGDLSCTPLTLRTFADEG